MGGRTLCLIFDSECMGAGRLRRRRTSSIDIEARVGVR